MRQIYIHIIILSVLFPSVLLQAQTAMPLLSADKIWKHVTTHCQPNGDITYSGYDTYILGDTIIEDIVYKKMYAIDRGDHYFYGAMRTEGTKVYFRPLWPSMEGMIYDFGAQAGDTLNLQNQQFSSDVFQMRVTSVDSVDLGNGMRKRIVVEDLYGLQSETWIDGMGSSYGLHLSGASFYYATCGNTELLCFTEDGENLYLNETYPSCNMNQWTTSIVSIDDDSDLLNFYPNPAKDVLNVNSSEMADYIKIFDLHGRLIIEKMPVAQNEVLNLSLLPGGIYIIAVSYRSGNLIINDKLFVD